MKCKIVCVPGSVKADKSFLEQQKRTQEFIKVRERVIVNGAIAAFPKK